MIDNYDEAMALIDQIKAHLPLPVYARRELIRSLRDKGIRMKARRRIMVNDALYAGDEGGILCALEPFWDGKEAVMSSITHLDVIPRHPLSKAIKAYQRERKRKLAEQNPDARPSSMTFQPKK